MKLYELHQPVLGKLTEQTILAEDILGSLKSGIESVKNYATNISAAVSVRSQLKSLDGTKNLTTENLAAEATRVRSELAAIANAASDKVKNSIIYALKKMKAASLFGPYLSRNYYHDLMAYMMVKPVAELTKRAGGKFLLDRVIDNLMGYVITVITGIPALDDIKDAGELARKMVKASNTLATKINSLRPTDIEEALELFVTKI
jgi:hypothetical protein